MKQYLVAWRETLDPVEHIGVLFTDQFNEWKKMMEEKSGTRFAVLGFTNNAGRRNKPMKKINIKELLQLHQEAEMLKENAQWEWKRMMDEKDESIREVIKTRNYAPARKAADDAVTAFRTACNERLSDCGSNEVVLEWYVHHADQRRVRCLCTNCMAMVDAGWWQNERQPIQAWNTRANEKV